MRIGPWFWSLVLLCGCAGDQRQASNTAETPPARVGSFIHDDEPFTRVLPALPPEAVAQGISGSVVLEIRIAETGDVSVLRVIRGHAMLNERAKAAVSQWKYRPVVIGGRDVPIIMVVVVSFDSPPLRRRGI